MRSSEFDAELLSARLDDLFEKAERYCVAASRFLTPREQIFAEKYVASRRGVNDSFFFGGYDGSERNKLFLLPDYLSGGEAEYDAEYIRANIPDACEQVGAVRISGSGYRVLSHRDYMGSLLGLGIERDSIGDIVTDGDFGAYVFCEPRIAEFICGELKKVASDTVKAETFTPSADFKSHREFALISDTVASARLDCVVAALANLPREKAQSVIAACLVEVNYETVKKNDLVVSEGCVISIRGHGKFIVKSLNDKTKKGRYRILADKYI